MLNEMLLLEVRAHETMAAEGSKERPPPDLVSRVRGYLEMRIHGEWMETVESSPTRFLCSESRDVLVFVSRSASASGGWRGVCRLHAELEGERLPDPAGATVSGHEQPIHQGKASVFKPITVIQLEYMDHQ